MIETGRYFRSECAGLVARTMEILAYGGPVDLTNDVRDNLNVFSPVDDHYETTLTTARTLLRVLDAGTPDAFSHPT